jgi:hypothetical protein
VRERTAATLREQDDRDDRGQGCIGESAFATVRREKARAFPGGSSLADGDDRGSSAPSPRRPARSHVTLVPLTEQFVRVELDWMSFALTVVAAELSVNATLSMLRVRRQCRRRGEV